MTLSVYPKDGYAFGAKAPRESTSASKPPFLQRLEQAYAREGMRRSVAAVMLVQVHGCAHVLLLEHGNELRLPGGRLRAGEAEADGLRRKLQSKLGASQPELAVRWDISELLAAFHRPHFTEHLYPFQPPHVTRLKEVHRLFAVQLPEHATFAVPKPSRLVAVPLFELHDNAARYGPVLASVPALLSRLQMNVQESSSSASLDAGATNDHDHQP